MSEEATTETEQGSAERRAAAAPEQTTPSAAVQPRREPRWALFRSIFALSALSWGGIALIAQLELQYVERARRLTRSEFSDLVALAWMSPGAVGCNVAVLVGHALAGGAGAWIAGAASVLPFFCAMTAFAAFYHSPVVRAFATPALINHFAVVLGTLIALTWYRQVRTLMHSRIEWIAAVLASAVLLFAQIGSVFVLLLACAFFAGWAASPERTGRRLAFSLTRRDKLLLAALTTLIAIFALPLPAHYQSLLVLPRLAGAALTLFGGGFSALPVLKMLFVAPGVGVTLRDFTLAFALSPVSPGPLLNVVPFLGYLIHGMAGAAAATLAYFVPSGALVVFARRHLQRLETNIRFEHGMRVLRAATTAFLVAAVAHVYRHVPFTGPALGTALFSLIALARFKMPVYAVYLIVAIIYTASTALSPR
ncbi:chromate transporter [Trinickia sp. EG282A]|uniref:chromate transporter n=1 Tax=Trinickia sp. EG282A TaxID=3237013 RepID=UPI0034D21D14